MNKILPYNSKLKEKARYLRNHSTLAEVLLWNQIKGKKISGYDFHRQKPIGNYIVDFYSPDLQLAIEIDGVSHLDKYNYDRKREDELLQYGISIIHFRDDEVKGHIDLCIEQIH